MTDDELRAFATLDAHGGKVTKRVEVLVPDPSADAAHEGLVAVRGEGPLGVLDEQVDDRAMHVGWVDPAVLRDWYRPDRVVVPLTEALDAGLQPGVFADTRGRGRVRVSGPEAHLGPDGRPAFRALAGPDDDPRVDVPLPRDEVVRLVAVAPGARTDDGTEALSIVSRPVGAVLPPGVYPDHSSDVVGLPPRPAHRSVRVRAFAVRDGARHEIERLDEQADTMWLVAVDGSSVPVAASAFGPDLVRYEATPA